jgi:hypothetical protein
MKGDDWNRASIPPLRPHIFLHLATLTMRVEAASAISLCARAVSLNYGADSVRLLAGKEL